MSGNATASFGLVQIGQIAVPVSDIERAIAYLLALMSEVRK